MLESGAHRQSVWFWSQHGLCSCADSKGLFRSHFQNPEASLLPNIIFIILYSWHLLYYDSIQINQFGGSSKAQSHSPYLEPLASPSHKDAMINCAPLPRIFSYLKILGN